MLKTGQYVYFSDLYYNGYIIHQKNIRNYLDEWNRDCKVLKKTVIAQLIVSNIKFDNNINTYVYELKVTNVEGYDKPIGWLPEIFLTCKDFQKPF